MMVMKVADAMLFKCGPARPGHDLQLSHCSLIRFLQPSRKLPSSLRDCWPCALVHLPSKNAGTGFSQAQVSLHRSPNASL